MIKFLLVLTQLFCLHSIAKPTDLSNYKSTSVFVKNMGQVRNERGEQIPEIACYFKGKGVKVFSTSTKLYYQFIQYLKKPSIISKRLDSIEFNVYKLEVELLGANKNTELITEEPLDYYENYYNQYYPEGLLNVPSCNKIIYKEVYPKIDWIIYSADNSIKYDFVVHPGGNPQNIKMLYKNHKNISIDQNNNLHVSVFNTNLTENAPKSFQENQAIPSTYVLDGDTLTFKLGIYNKSKVLTIDPTIEWSTYFGGNSDDVSYALDIDSNNDVVLGGYTISTTLFANVFQTLYGGGLTDAFLTKFNKNGNIIFSTYFGGNQGDYIYSIDCDKIGNIYCTGVTQSTNGIAYLGYQNQFTPNSCINCNDAIIAKFNAQGLRVWSSYFGSTSEDGANEIKLTQTGKFYITGSTTSLTGLNINSSSSYNGGSYDIFIAKFDTSCNIMWSKYFGGSLTESPSGLLVDGESNIYITGGTNSTNNIVTSGSYQTSISGLSDGFIVNLDSNANLIWGTYFGGPSAVDATYDIVIDSLKNIYIAGVTQSTSGISFNGYQNTFAGANDLYIAKFNNSGGLIWSTYFGGFDAEDDPSISISNIQSIVVCSPTSSQNFNMTNAFQPIYGGGPSDGLIAKFDLNGNLIWSSFFGGPSQDVARKCSVGLLGEIYITGSTQSLSGIANNAYQNSNNGSSDNFLLKIFDPSLQPQSAFNTTSTQTCSGSCITFNNASTNDSTWLWLFPGGNPSSSTLKNPPAICYNTTGTYNVTLITSNGLVTDTLTINNYITVNPTPNVQVFTDSVICVGDTISLSATGGATYQWAGPNNFNSSSPTPSILNASPSNSGTYTVIGTNNFGCTDTTTIQISVSPSIPIQASSNSPICEGSALNLSSSAGSQYLWSGPNGFTSTAQNPVISSTALQNSGSYSVTVTNDCGTSTVSINAIINASPIALIATTDTVLCENDTLNLLGSGIGAFLWTGPSGFSSNQQNNTLTNLISSNTGIYTLIVTNTQGCSDTASVFVKTGESDCFFIPSVFTPNGDGINDTWVIDGLSEFPNCLVRVFNRWGQLLFDNKGYAQPWDGVYDGNPCPIADYYYVIDLGTDKKTFTGTVTIKR